MHTIKAIHPRDARRLRRSGTRRRSMRVVVALGGNALLQRGEPMTAEHQRRTSVAAGQLATRRQGPRADRVARQRPAGRAAGPPGRGVHGSRALSARRARRRDAGDDRLPARAGARQPAAVRGAARDDPHDGRSRPGRSRLRRSDEVRRARLRRGRRASASQPTTAGPSSRTAQLAAGRALAAPSAHLRDPADALAARAGRHRHLRRRRRDPDDLRAGRGPPAPSASRRSSTRTSPAPCWRATWTPTCS